MPSPWTEYLRAYSDRDDGESTLGSRSSALLITHAMDHHTLSAAIERDLTERFAPAERRQAHVMLTQYGMSPHERDVEHVRRAMLALSGGNLGRLGFYLAAAQRNYQDVLYWAKHPDQAPQRGP